MNTVQDTIDTLGGRGVVANDLGVTYGTVRSWCSLDSIPSRYWLDIVDAAEARDIKGITLESLAAHAAASRNEAA